MAAPLTPGLTPQQRRRVADLVRQIGGVPLGAITPAFMDADRAASRALNPRAVEGFDASTMCSVVAPELAAGHRLSLDAAGYVYGLAMGLREGCRFGDSARFAKRLRFKADGYAKLSEDDRRKVGQYIQKLLKAAGKKPTDPPPTGKTKKKAAPETNAESARRWIREAGAAARRGA